MKLNELPYCSVFGKSTVTTVDSAQLTVRHLLDDSVLEEPHLMSPVVDLDPNSPGTPIDSLNDDCSLLSRTR